MIDVDSKSPVTADVSSTTGGLTLVVIILNVAAFGLMALSGVPVFEPTGDSLIRWGANYGPLTLGGQWWRLVASLFLHFGLIHLVVNMVVLARIGPFMEALLGRSPFAILYLLAGLGGGLVALVLHPWTVSAGASGAIFGLYGALLAYLLRHRHSLPRETLTPLLKGAAIFVGYNLVYGLFRPEIDLAAHLGGLMAGFLLGLYLAQPVSQKGVDAGRSRGVVAGVFGLALTGGIFSSLPKPNDFSTEFKHMADVEAKSVALYNSSLQSWKSDQIKDEQLTAVLADQILPPWRAERVSSAHLKGISEKQKQLESLLVQYMQVREDSWSLLLHGVRTRNLGEVRRSGEKNTEADKLIERLSTSSGN